MAYTRRKNVRTRRAAPRARVARRSTGRTYGRRTTGRRSSRSASPRTIRIVVETAAANPVQRPLGLVEARKPRKPAFAT